MKVPGMKTKEKEKVMKCTLTVISMMENIRRENLMGKALIDG